LPATDSSSDDHDGLTIVLGKLRRAAAALKEENQQLRAEVAGLRLAGWNDGNGDAPGPALGTLAEIALPAGSGAPGAARMIVRHCLSGLVTHRILDDAELLVSELVTNSVVHGELAAGETVLVSIHVAADKLRFDIDNPGTVGVVAAATPAHPHREGGFGLKLVDLLAARWGVSRSDSTNVWFELSRA
jgi:anti-sigma regulatory factor (Ser/Thr protein kinase)